MSGFIWPQSSLARWCLFTWVVLKRLGYAKHYQPYGLTVFEFSVSKPDLDGTGRREVFFLSHQSAACTERVYFHPQSIWAAPIANFLWVDHPVSGNQLVLCFPSANPIADRHLASWIKSYKRPPAESRRDPILPLLGGIR